MDNEEEEDLLYHQKPVKRADLGRNVLTLEDLSEKYHFQQKSPSKYHEKIKSYAKKECQEFSCPNFLTSVVPILGWLPKYSLKTDLVNDLVSGFTVAIMHIPQGMAYGLLAGVDPVVGIYTAFFPVLIYVLLGTMPHVSMGTFAVISIMVSKPVMELGADPLAGPGNLEAGQPVYSRIQVAAAVTFCVGLVQFLAGLGRLGFLSMVLTDTLVSAFTVGASFHVITSQIKHILGVSITRQSGPGNLPLTYIEIGKNIATTNLFTLGISLCVIVVCILMDKIVGPKTKRFCRFPLPTQLMIIIIFTSLSQFLGFRTNYGVKTIDNIGQIPVGIPHPEFPIPELIPKVLLDSVAPAVVSFAIGLGLGKLFGKKHGYEIRSNQELLAQGASNLFGSFFNCIPMAGSLSRSVVQEASGCRTNITSLTSAILLLSVMLYLGPLFQPLPVAVLASIILASLVGIVQKILEVKKYWDISPQEGIVWIVTFLSTVLLDVDYGLILGVLSTLLMTVVRSVRPSLRVLEKCDTGVWLDKNNFKTEGGTKVVQVFGPLHFLAYDSLRERIERELTTGPDGKVREDPGNVVFDISGVSFLDRRGMELVTWLEDWLTSRGCYLGVVATPQQTEHLKVDSEIFPTYTDALLILQSNTSANQAKDIV